MKQKFFKQILGKIPHLIFPEINAYVTFDPELDAKLWNNLEPICEVVIFKTREIHEST